MDLTASSSSTSLLEHYEQQYAVASAEITMRIGKLASTSAGDRMKIIAEIEKLLDDSQELMEQMDFEIRSLDSQIRTKYTNRILSYKAELNRLCQEYSKLKNKIPKYQVSDSLGQYTEYSDIHLEQKQRLLDTSEQLEMSNKHLDNGYRIAVETEQIGSQMLNDLHSQRETIRSSLNRLRETNSDIGHSSRLLTAMVNRTIRHKIIVTSVGIVFVLVTCYAVYLKMS